MENQLNRSNAATSDADRGIVSIQHALTQAVTKICTLRDSDDYWAVSGVATGYRHLDRMTSGLQPGSITVIASRPAMGKTAFATNIAEHVAIALRLPVLIFCGEISADLLAVRFLASKSKIDISKLNTGRLSDEDIDRIAAAQGELASAPIHISDGGLQTMKGLYARAQELRHENGKLGLIVIDSIDVLFWPSHKILTKKSRAVALSLKKFAKDFNVPVIVLSQLSRRMEHRKNKRPILSDFRKESRALAQIADVLIFLYRDHYYGKKLSQPDLTEVTLASNRLGLSGAFRLVFFENHLRFSVPE
jgi:replicative DNA helicase